MAQSALYTLSDYAAFWEPLRRYRTRGTQSALDLLIPRYTLHIVAALRHEERHFNQLMRDIYVSSNTLRNRLRSLEEQGIVARRVESHIPPSVIYRLTEKGMALTGVIDAILEWEKQWIEARPTKAVILLEAAEPKRAYGEQKKTGRTSRK